VRHAAVEIDGIAFIEQHGSVQIGVELHDTVEHDRIFFAAVANERSELRTVARFQFGDVVLTTKLIDGTFPDYARVIPTGNDKLLVVDRDPFKNAVDRVATLSSERGRAIKLAIAEGKITLSVNNPDSGSASEEIEANYDSAPIDIGFNARYLLDIVGQLSSDTASIRLADPGSPTLIQDREGAPALFVLMPLRV